MSMFYLYGLGLPRSKTAFVICLGFMAGLTGFLSSVDFPAAGGQSTVPAHGVIRGSVLAEDNRGLPQAAVSLRRVGDDPGMLRWTNTDEAGRFQFESLADGAYHLTASSPGYVKEEDPITGKAEEILYYPGDSATLRMVKGGVITGTVTDAGGNPAVNAQVQAIPIGPSLRESPQLRIGFSTDDRGIYRIYGLRPGRYRVRAGGSASSYMFSPHDGIASSFYSTEIGGLPSEVEVRTGLELSGIDIRLRDEFGQSIRGKVVISSSLKIPVEYAEVNLVQADTGILAATGATSKKYLGWEFALHHIPEGNYYLVGQTLRDEDLRGMSSPLRVSIRGSDVNGLQLTLSPLGALSGKVVLEQTVQGSRADCSNISRDWMKRLVLRLLRLSEKRPERVLDFLLPPESEAVPAVNGEFHVQGLAAGKHRLIIQLPNSTLYVKSVRQTSPAPAKGQESTSRLIFSVRSGQEEGGLQITLAAGASSVHGKTNFPKGETGTPGDWRIFLVPMETGFAEDVLRYAEARPQGNGNFTMLNLAPGTYRILAWPVRRLPVPSSDLPVFFSASFRKQLRQTAAAQGLPVILSPCQSIENLELSLHPPSSGQ